MDLYTFFWCVKSAPYRKLRKLMLPVPASVKPDRGTQTKYVLLHAADTQTKCNQDFLAHSHTNIHHVLLGAFPHDEAIKLTEERNKSGLDFP